MTAPGMPEPLTPAELAAKRSADTTAPDFGGMDRERLIAQARRFWFDAAEWQRRARAIQPAADAIYADHAARLGRVWALVNHRRKTVQMDALRAALGEPPALDADAEHLAADHELLRALAEIHWPTDHDRCAGDGQTWPCESARLFDGGEP